MQDVQKHTETPPVKPPSETAKVNGVAPPSEAAFSVITAATPEDHRNVLISACSRALRFIPVDDDRDMLFKIRLSLKRFLGDYGEWVYVAWKTEDRRTQKQKEQDTLNRVESPEAEEAKKEYQNSRIKEDNDQLHIASLFYYASERGGYRCAFYEFFEPTFNPDKLDVTTIDIMLPGALRGVAILKHYIPSQFRKLRDLVKEKKLVSQIKEFDRAVNQKYVDIFGSEVDETPSPIAAMTDKLELFRTPDGIPIAVIPVNGHFENHIITTKGNTKLKQWLTHRAYKEFDRYVPRPHELEVTLERLVARALHDSPVCEVFLGVGQHEGKYYLDLCDAQWRAIEISKDGWRVVFAPPIKFIRHDGMLSIPEPQAGGSVDLLREIINADDYNFKLMVAWLLWSMLPIGPYPILSITGPAEATKTSTAERLKKVADNNEVLSSGQPKNVIDLFVAAKNSRIQVLNNLSQVSQPLSDALCTIIEGGGYKARQLYTDDEENSFKVMRPVIVVSIRDIMSKPDLRSRVIFIHLERPTEFKSKEQLEATFNKLHPLILDALLDVLVYGLQRLDSTEEKSYSRFTTFCKLMNACEAKLGWYKGEFDEIYRDNMKHAAADILDSSQLATLIAKLLRDNKGHWKNPVAFLLDNLKAICKGDMTLDLDDLGFLKNARKLNNALIEIEPVLKESGIRIERRRDGPNGERNIIITRDKGQGE